MVVGNNAFVQPSGRAYKGVFAGNCSVSTHRLLFNFDSLNNKLYVTKTSRRIHSVQPSDTSNYDVSLPAYVIKLFRSNFVFSMR